MGALQQDRSPLARKLHRHVPSNQAAHGGLSRKWIVPCSLQQLHQPRTPNRTRLKALKSPPRPWQRGPRSHPHLRGSRWSASSPRCRPSAPHRGESSQSYNSAPGKHGDAPHQSSRTSSTGASFRVHSGLFIILMQLSSRACPNTTPTIRGVVVTSGPSQPPAAHCPAGCRLGHDGEWSCEAIDLSDLEPFELSGRV